MNKLADVSRFMVVWVASQASRVRREETGATMVEYGLIVALIAAVCITLVKTLGTQIQSAFQTIVTNI